jgi:hypothetical protein
MCGGNFTGVRSMKRIGLGGLALWVGLVSGATAEIAPMEQVTSVSQLKDVRPTDWAFQALQSLVERYGCIAGYPDRSFRGNRALTRYEFAAGLNACLDRVNELIAASTSNFAKKEDLAKIQALQTEFAKELVGLKGRVDGLEGKAKLLESQQFSTTTKLYGQVVMGLQGSNRTDVDFFPRNGLPEREGKANTTFGYNAQITLATSFRGDDLLITGLQTGNLSSTAPVLFSNMGRLAYESEQSNQLVVSDLSYRFPLGDRFGVVVGAAGVNPENTFRGINPLEGFADGALSLFAQRNPILSLGGTSAGIGFDWQMGDRVSLQGVYSAGQASDVASGLFKGRYGAGLQLTLSPTNSVDVGLHYLYAHSPDGELGFGVGDTQIYSPFAIAPGEVNTQAIGATAAWRVNKGLTLGLWGGWTTSNPKDLDGSVQTTNWAVFGAFPDLFVPGNLGGVILGQPPKIVGSSLPEGFNFPRFSQNGEEGGQPDTSLHLELFYRARLSQSFAITPGLLVVFNPNHNGANETLLVGALRGSFQF